MKNLAYVDLGRLVQPISEYTHSVWSVGGEGLISHIRTVVPLPGRLQGSDATLTVILSLENGLEEGAVARGIPSIALNAGQMAQLIVYLENLEKLVDQQLAE